MKYIDVVPREDSGDFVRDLMNVFGEDMRNAIKKNDFQLTSMEVLGIIHSFIDDINFAIEKCAQESKKLRCVRIEAEVWPSGALLFSFTPLGDDVQPLFEKKRVSHKLLFGTPADIREFQRKFKHLKVTKSFQIPPGEPSEN